MKTVNNQAFWREILEHVAHMILVFRVDQDEKVHLMYTNQTIHPILGFTPEQYVMLSESDGVQANDLHKLSDAISGMLQHQVQQPFGTCRLHTSSMQPAELNFTFQTFQSSVGKTPLIVVTLWPGRSGVPDESTEFFVAESASTKAILKKMEGYTASGDALWFIGGQGVGKLTLALRSASMSGWPVSRIEDRDSINDVDYKNQDQLTLIVRNAEKTLKYTASKLRIIQDHRKRSKKATRVIITSAVPPEVLMEKGELDPNWYYTTGFQLLSVAPLRLRKEDARAAAEGYARNFIRAAKLEMDQPLREQINRIANSGFPGNFNDLFSQIRSTLLENQAPSKSIAGLPKEIKPFDQMVAHYLRQVLDQTGGKIYGPDGAASMLKMRPTTLQSKLIKYGVKK